MGLLRDIGILLGFIKRDVEEPEVIDDSEFGEGEEEEEDFRRKFVSGLFYCGGSKRQFFAETYERGGTDRSTELIQFLEESHPDCSEMRSNFGYSDDLVEDEDIGTEYPEIEEGEL